MADGVNQIGLSSILNFPASVAQAVEFEQGEVAEWFIDDHQNFVLKRSDQAVADLKKTQDQARNIKSNFEDISNRCTETLVIQGYKN